MKFLEQARKSRQRNEPVKYLLHKHLAGFQLKRSHKVIHVSALTKQPDFCPREYVLMDLIKPPTQREFVSTAERVTFDYGHAVQDLVVGWLAQQHRAVGHWRCVACSSLHEFRPRPQACLNCKVRVLEPEEVVFVSAVTGASCSVDCFVQIDHPKLRMVEIKSVKAEEWKPLAGPMAEHRVRASMYLRTIAESDMACRAQVDTERATILYVSKGGYMKDETPQEWGLTDAPFSPFKEFVIDRDDSLTDRYADLALQVTQARNGGVMPAGICPTAVCKRAKQCSMVQVCFGGKYPAGKEISCL